MSFGLTLSYDDLGVRSTMGELRALNANLRTEVLAPIGQELETTTLERFQTGTGPDGQAWAPSYRVKLNGGLTLVQSGRLRESVTYFADDDSVEIGSPEIRAAVHQFGATITAKGAGGLAFTLADGTGRVVQSVTIPARPFVGLSIEDGVLVAEIAEQALIRVFDRSVG